MRGYVLDTPGFGGLKANEVFFEAPEVLRNEDRSPGSLAWSRAMSLFTYEIGELLLKALFPEENASEIRARIM